MSEKPILMTPPNIVAIDEGRKTMTRRETGLKEINKDPGSWHYIDSEGFYNADERGAYNPLTVKPPYAVGDKLWIKEAHYQYGVWSENGLTKTGRQKWRFLNTLPPRIAQIVYFNDNLPTNLHITPNSYRKEGWYKRSTLFMPKKFARKWLLVTNVKAPERIQDISEADCLAEGVMPNGRSCNYKKEMQYKVYLTKKFVEGKWDGPGYYCRTGGPRICFQMLWNSIHGVGAWARNEWVWPIEFKKIED